MFRFKCATCDDWHEGIPAFGFNAPSLYETIPEGERPARCGLTTDLCIVDNKDFFVLGRLETPVEGQTERFAWLLWVSLSEDSFAEYERHYEVQKRSHLGPYSCRIAVDLPLYPPALGLGAKLLIRDNFQRPLIVLDDASHPLVVEQRSGVTAGRLIEIVTYGLHGPS